jgi:transposase
MTGKQGSSPESIVREIKRQTRRKFTAEEKIRIGLESLRGEAGITDLCRKEGIHPTMYYKWSKAFLEAGKRQLNGDTIREAGSDEVKELRLENDALKMVVAEPTLRNRTVPFTSGTGDTTKGVLMNWPLSLRICGRCGTGSRSGRRSGSSMSPGSIRRSPAARSTGS